MFDYMIRVLPNGRILVRDNASKTAEVMKPKEVSSYLEKALEAQIEAQDAEDKQIADTKASFQEEYQKWHSENIGPKKDNSDAN